MTREMPVNLKRALRISVSVRNNTKPYESTPKKRASVAISLPKVPKPKT